MKTLLMLLTMVLAQNAFAQASAEEGLSRIESNIENSKANIKEYEKNIQIVDANIAEVNKAKKKLDEQNDNLKGVIKDNKKTLADYQKQNLELDKLTLSETKKLDQGALKIKELEVLLANLKTNQEALAKNIQNYKDQKLKLETDKKEWDARALSLAKTNSDLESQIKALKAEEQSWKGKRKGYEGEVSRWTKELEKQQKLQSDMKALIEAKE